MAPPRSRVAALLLAIVAPGAAGANGPFVCPAKGGPPWREFRTEHFVLRTDLEPVRGAEMVRELEFARSAVLHAAYPSPPSIPGAIHAVAFSDDDDFEDVSPPKAAAFFTTLDGFTPTVVLPATLRARTRAVLIHEMTHRFSSFSLLRRPMWLDEGYAVYMESMGSVTFGGKMTVGTVPEGVPVLASRTDRVRVRDLLAWKQVDTAWGADLVRRYYASSWLLVHYLVNRQPAALGDFFRRLGRAEDPFAAWKASFPRWDPALPGGLDDLEDAIDAYGRGGEYQYRKLDLQVSPVVTEHSVQPAEVHALRAALLALRGDAQGAQVRAEVDEAIAEDPGSPGALAVMVRLRSREDTLPLARAAVKVHPEDWRAWSALASSLGPGTGAERLAARRKAAALAPEEPLALLFLARDLEAASLPDEAAPHALRLLRLAPYSSVVHETMAAVAMRLDLCDAALRSQQRAIETLSDRAPAQSREAAERLLGEYVRRCAARPSTPAAVP
jgi:tetratricopeptide (TPR) repeat protein